MDVLVRSSYIRRRDMDSVLNCLVTDRLDNGDFYDKFIKTARERFGFEYGLFVRSPMIALDTALLCLGLAAGDTVALSALSKAWAGKVVQARGYTPLWLDVDEASGSIAEKAVETLNGSAAKALYLAEPWGIFPNPCLLEAVSVPIVEDISYSIGARSDAKKAGELGIFTIVGLEPASAFTAGSGALLYAQGRRDAQALRNTGDSLVQEELACDMNAALALTQLKDSDKFFEKRRELSELYAQSLARARKRPLQASFDGEPSYFGCVVLFDAGIKDIRAYAKKKGVDTVMAFDDTCSARGFVPEGSCPVAASLVNRAVAFPLNQRISKTAAQKTAKVLATLP